MDASDIVPLRVGCAVTEPVAVRVALWLRLPDILSVVPVERLVVDDPLPLVDGVIDSE